MAPKKETKKTLFFFGFIDDSDHPTNLLNDFVKLESKEQKAKIKVITPIDICLKFIILIFFLNIFFTFLFNFLVNLS